MTRVSTADRAAGTDGLVVGAGVHIEPGRGTSWPGHITFISDRIVGVRGYSPVDRHFRIRDQVTMHIGHGDERVSSRVQVLAADGSLLRVVRRDDTVDKERRRSQRVSVQLAASVSLQTDESCPPARLEVELIELSTSGCALHCSNSLRVGTPVRLCLPYRSTPIELDGIVVRTWIAGTPPLPHGGIQFDPMPAATTQLLNHFLIERFRAAG